MFDEQRIVDLKFLLSELSAIRATGDTIVVTNGCFDLIHPGHVSYLERARRLGHCLVVAVNDDASVRRLKGKSRPLHSLADRMRVLAALRAVDWVVAFSEDTPAALIEAVSPNILVKGGDYAVHEVAGGDWVVAHGGRVEILPFEVGHSTTATFSAAAQLVAREQQGTGGS